MPEMLGNRFLPESVVARRREVRERVNNLRRPLKEFRQSTIPGPDVIGEVESTVTDVRDRFVRRDSVMEMISNRRGGDGSSDGSSGSEPEQPGRRDKADRAV